MSNNSPTVTLSAPWLFLAFITLLALKYTAYPTIPWWLVSLPIVFPLVVVGALFGVMFLIAVLSDALK